MPTRKIRLLRRLSKNRDGKSVLAFKSLRVKVVVLALVPIFLVMGAVSITAYQAVVKTARDVVERRDIELARIAAARLAENLSQYVRNLQNLAATDDCRSLHPSRIGNLLNATGSWLYLYDGGVTVYNRNGGTVWSTPYSDRKISESFPFPVLFSQLRRTLRPVFSNVFSTGPADMEVIMIGVPIIGPEGDFIGALTGLCSVKYSLLGTTYSRVLEFKSGRSAYAYLVDGDGRVLYHRHSSLLGTMMKKAGPVAKVIRGESGAMLTRSSTGEQIISGFAPVPGTGWGIITNEDWAVVSKPIIAYIKYFWGMLWAGGILSALLIFIFISRSLKPIVGLTRGAEQIAAGKFDKITVHPTGDELEDLALQFNTMADALKDSFASLARHRNHLEELVEERTRDLEAAQEELIKHEKLSMLGQLTATVSHELRNPLGVIRSSIYYLQRTCPEAEEKTFQHLNRIKEQVQMCDTIVNDLLDYTRARQPDPVFEQINPFLEKILDQLGIPENVRLVRQLAPEMPIVPFDRNKLQRVVTNLVENAVNAVQMRLEKTNGIQEVYEPEVRVATHAARNSVRLEVADNGVGMTAQVAERAFDPLYTTRARGVGLGLAIVKKIADEHNGTVHLDTQPDQGTRITVEIPRWGQNAKKQKEA
jgi:signal transduction histidine kinase